MANLKVLHWHLCGSLVTEEKKSLKRTFQQIQEEEDDDYPGSYSPQDPTAGPLLVCLEGWGWRTVEVTSAKMYPQGGAINKYNLVKGGVQFRLGKSLWNWINSCPKTIRSNLLGWTKGSMASRCERLFNIFKAWSQTLGRPLGSTKILMILPVQQNKRLIKGMYLKKRASGLWTLK